MGSFLKGLSSLLVVGLAAYSTDRPLLEALKYAVEHIPPEEWKERLIQANIDSLDNHILDRLVLRYPVRKDIGLPALLALCQEIEKNLPENADFEKECLMAIADELYIPPHARLILNWVMTSLPPPEVGIEDLAADLPVPSDVDDGLLAADQPQGPLPIPEVGTEDLAADLPVPSGTDDPLLAGESSETIIEKDLSSSERVSASLGSGASDAPSASPQDCLNFAHLLYMDWVYYASLPSVFQPPMCCPGGNLARDDAYTRRLTEGFFLAEPHYTFANVRFEKTSCAQNAAGISLLGGGVFLKHWVLSGKFDYGRSWNNWDPQSGETDDSTNRWSLIPSLTYQFEQAYVQCMVTGCYNHSKIHNANAQTPVHINHWGIGARLDGGVDCALVPSFQYWLRPYLCLDYFSAFQEDVDLLNVVWIKRANFFQAKGQLQFFAEVFPSPAFCLIPQASVGFALANVLSRTSLQGFCDAAPDYPDPRALSLGGGISIFHKRGFVAKAQIDIALCQSVQIYNGNLALGWSW